MIEREGAIRKRDIQIENDDEANNMRLRQRNTVYDHASLLREVPSHTECGLVAEQQFETMMLKKDQAYNKETSADCSGYQPPLGSRADKVTFKDHLTT